jgi:hypothetical protein
LANLNKENIVIVDVKNATVSTSGSMSFYTTDVGTCNIYCQLVINESKNSLINKYAPIENSEDFNVRMGIIKPNFEPKYIDFSIRNAVEAFFCAELPDDCKDIDGEYKCELYVESNTTLESGEQQLEKITTAPFSYKVNKSIMSAIDDAIVGNLGQAILKTLATVAYVDDSIAEIPETDLLKDFATRSFVNEVLVQHNSEIAQRDYASKQHVKDMVDGVRYDISEANYASQSYVNESISGLNTSITSLLTRNYAPIAYVDYKIEDAISNIEISGGGVSQQEMAEHVNSRLQEYDETISTRYYATEGYVDRKISEAQLGGEGGSVDLSDYATKADLNKTVVVIEKEEIGFDDLPSGISIVRLIGNLKITGVNGKTLMNTPQFSDEIIRVEKLNFDYSNLTKKTLEIYTFDNRHILCDLLNETMKSDIYNVTESYVDNAIANIEIPEVEMPDLTDYATKEELNTALGNIESLLKEI